MSLLEQTKALIEYLSRGVEIAAGVLTLDDARAFVTSGIAHRCRRVLIEPLELDPDRAVRNAAGMEKIVTAAGIALEQVHHGYGVACWAVNRRALARASSQRNRRARCGARARRHTTRAREFRAPRPLG